MPFFQQSHFSPEAALFQLLSELDQPGHEQEQKTTCSARRQHRPQETFTPRFDITETSDAYELYGEVAGLDSDNLDIEFSDAQTLIIKGKVERDFAKTAPAATTQVDNAVETASQKSDDSHKATVEDEYDEADTPLATPATTTATVTANPEKQQQTAQAAVPKPKYWVAERRVGSFARSFSFSQRIEQDGVQAGLRNGILHVVVPKSLKSKKVAVSLN